MSPKRVFIQLIRQPARTVLLVLLLTASFCFCAIELNSYMNAIHTKEEIVKNYPTAAYVSLNDPTISWARTEGATHLPKPVIQKSEVEELVQSPFVTKVNESISVAGSLNRNHLPYLKDLASSVDTNVGMLIFDGTVVKQLEHALPLDAAAQSDQPAPDIPVYRYVVKIQQIYDGDLTIHPVVETTNAGGETVTALSTSVKIAQPGDEICIMFQTGVMDEQTEQRIYQNWIHKLVPGTRGLFTAFPPTLNGASTELGLASLYKNARIFMEGDYIPIENSYNMEDMRFQDDRFILSDSLCFYGEDDSLVEQYRERLLTATEFMQSAFPITFTDDLRYIRDFADGNATIRTGQGFSDYTGDKKVCVISQQLAQQYKLTVGDTLSIRLNEGMLEPAYVTAPSPYFTQALYDKNQGRQADTYEIIGTYFTKNVCYDTDINFIDPNTIFVPMSLYPAHFTKPDHYYENTVSFALQSPEVTQAFLDQLNNAGFDSATFQLSFENSGYTDEIAASKADMVRNAKILLLVAIVLAFGVLLLVSYLTVNKRLSVFAIYTAFGFSNKRPAMWIVCETLFLGLCAIGLALAVSCVLTSAFNRVFLFALLCSALTLALLVLNMVNFCLAFHKPTLTLLQRSK